MSDAQVIQQIYSSFGSADFSSRWVAQDWTLRDMVGYGAGQNQYNFFTAPQGTLDPVLQVVKKREQSNLSTPNQIGGDYYFVAQGMRLNILIAAKNRQTTTTNSDAFYSARQLLAAQLVNAIMNQAVLRFTINQKVILTEFNPFQRFPAGFGLGEVCPPAVGTGAATAINGGANAYASCSPYDIDGGQQGDPWTFGQPLVLAPSTTFQVDLVYPFGSNPSPANIYGSSANQTAVIWLGCYLTGQKLRAVS